MSRTCAGVLFFTVACGMPPPTGRDGTQGQTKWHPVPQQQSATQRGDMAIDAISPAQPVPGQSLLIRGTGFGQDPSQLLVRLAGGRGMQRRAVWLHPDRVTADLLELTVPGQLTGMGTILVESREGRSNVGSLQFQDARPKVMHVRLLPVETLVAVTGVPGGVTATELVVDGRSMGAMRELGDSVYSGPGFLQWAGPHEVVLRFSNGTQSPQFHVENR
jgi:hypothetical protein